MLLPPQCPHSVRRCPDHGLEMLLLRRGVTMDMRASRTVVVRARCDKADCQYAIDVLCINMHDAYCIRRRGSKGDRGQSILGLRYHISVTCILNEHPRGLEDQRLGTCALKVFIHEYQCSSESEISVILMEP